MSRDPAERRLERETEEYERQREADRVADHSPAPAEWRGGWYALPVVAAFKTELLSDEWRAEIKGVCVAVGRSEAEAVGKLMLSLTMRGAAPQTGMPVGIVSSTGFPPGYQAETVHGEPVVRLGTNGDPSRGLPEWTSYETPKLSPEAIGELEIDRALFGDCYVKAMTGERVPASLVRLRVVKGLGEIEGGEDGPGG